MKISSRFTVAVHTLLAVNAFGDKFKTTSEFIASSVNVNPVVIRRTLGSLKEAGLVDVKAGSGGASVLRPLEEITLYDIYSAVGCAGDDLFRFHSAPNPDCPVGGNIEAALLPHLGAAQAALEAELKKVTLFSLSNELSSLISKQN